MKSSSAEKQRIFQRYRLVILIALSLVAFLFSLALFEMGVRMFLPPPRILKLDIQGFHGEGGYMLSQDPHLIYLPRPGGPGYNMQGYKGKALPTVKSPEKIRILFMGDSVVNGIKLPPEQCMPSLLEQGLGEPYEVINFGVPGYNLAQEYEYLKVRGVGYDPDIVLFGMTFNDLEMSDLSCGELPRIVSSTERTRLSKAFLEKFRLLEAWCSWSKAYQWFKFSYLSKRRSAATRAALKKGISFRLSTGEVNGMLRNLKTLAESNHFKLAFVFFPVRNVDEKDLFALNAAVRDQKIPSLRQSEVFLKPVCFNLFG